MLQSGVAQATSSRQKWLLALVACVAVVVVATLWQLGGVAVAGMGMSGLEAWWPDGDFVVVVAVVVVDVVRMLLVVGCVLCFLHAVVVLTMEVNNTQSTVHHVSNSLRYLRSLQQQ